MRIKKIILSIIILNMLFVGVNTYAEESDFSDVALDSEIYGDAQFLKNLGIIEGIGNNMLGPELTVIRGDFAVMIDKTINFGNGLSNAFSDCPDGSYFAKAVNRVAEHGIINGYDNGLFKPYNKINKQEAATILVKAYENEMGNIVFAKSAAKKFNDYDSIAQWAKPYIDKAYILGLVRPKSDDFFGATDEFTRGETVTAISKLILSLSEKKKSDFGAKNYIEQWNRGNIFVGNEPMGFTLETGNDLVEYVVTDYNNKVIEHSTKMTKNGRVDFIFKNYNPGYYEVRIFSADSEGIKHEIIRTSMCLLEEYDFKNVLAEESGFGINMHADRGGSGWQYDLLKEVNIMGAKHVRDGYEWSSTENSQGNYTYNQNKIENYFNLLNNYGMSIIIVTGFNNKYYDNGATPYTDEGRKAYANYSKSFFDMYKGNQSQDMYNEFWGFGDRGNGPADCLPESYAPLLKTIYETIKASHPEATLHFCVGFNDWRRRLFELGALNYCDVINLHRYGVKRDSDISLEEDMRDEFKKLREDINDFAPDKINLPIWNTETGGNTSTNKNGNSEETMAQHIPRVYAINKAEGVERVYIYDLIDDGNRDGEHEDRFGLLRAFGSKYGSYTPKPSFVSYATIARQLTGYECLSNKSFENGIEWYKFMKGDKTINMLHTRGLPSEQQYKDVAIYTDAVVKITDIMGVSKKYVPINGKIYLTLNGDPLYVDGAISDIKEESIIEITPDKWIPTEKAYTIETKATDAIASSMTVLLDEREYKVGESAVADNFVLKGTRKTVIELNNDGNICGRIVIPVRADDNYNLAVETRVEPNDDAFSSIFKLTFQNNAPYTVNAQRVLIDLDGNLFDKPINESVEPNEAKDFEIEMGKAELGTSHVFKARMNVDGNLSEVINAEGKFQNNAIQNRTINIDGILDDEMENERYLSISEDGERYALAMDGSKFEGEQDFSGKVWITYDEENLYIVADVIDNEHYAKATDGSIWKNDSVQIDLYQHETQGYNTTTGYTEIGVSLLDGEKVSTWSWNSVKKIDNPLDIDGLVAAITRNASTKHTVYEIAIKWKDTLDIDVDNISRIDLSVAFNDCDNGVRQTAFEVGGGVIYSKNPSQYNKYSLIR